MLCGNRPLVRKKPIGEQVIIVTGASSGVGRAIARAAGERGAKVVVAARGEDGLKVAVEEVERAGSEALAVPGDLAKQEQNEELVRRALERFGRIDTFVANAIVTIYAGSSCAASWMSTSSASPTPTGPRCRR